MDFKDELLDVKNSYELAIKELEEEILDNQPMMINYLEAYVRSSRQITDLKRKLCELKWKMEASGITEEEKDGSN